MASRKKSVQITDFDRCVSPYRFDGSQRFDIDKHPTDDKGGLHKEAAHRIIAANRDKMRVLQEKLYAQDRWSLLLIFQGMDAAGKDGAIEHVMSGINPQGCQVYSFKTPSPQELDHDFMWRTSVCLPERGRIGIFNRSYYEECLVVRVHPEILAKQRLPRRLVTKNIWRERFEDIVSFERYMARNGTIVLKFFLHISKDEQKERFLERLDEPSKNWKFSMADVSERRHWDDYQKAYEDLIRQTSTPTAPWHVVPADYKWFARVVIGSTIVNALEQLKLKFPKVDKASLRQFARVRDALEHEGNGAQPASTPSTDPAAMPAVDAEVAAAPTLPQLSPSKKASAKSPSSSPPKKAQPRPAATAPAAAKS
jgi:PPK2 family polyphosphate:nucleotide phosphotransferase